MPRATIVVEVDNPQASAVYETWYQRWNSRLSYRSENQGCGCSVNIWDFEGPTDAVAAIPALILSDSERARQHPHKS